MAVKEGESVGEMERVRASATLSVGWTGNISVGEGGRGMRNENKCRRVKYNMRVMTASVNIGVSGYMGWTRGVWEGIRTERVIAGAIRKRRALQEGRIVLSV